ncbi:hypothetical protein ACQ4PT_054375 [Festuca glaucescens]
MAAMQQQHASHLLLLLLPVFLLLAAGGVSARASSVIRSTCAAVAKSTPYPYCVLTMSANPAAASATDARGLAAAVADLTTANVTRTIDVLNELIRGLQGCVFTYQAMQGSVAGALDDLRAGRLHPASSKLRAASWQPDYCDLDLLQIINKDPIIDENNASHLLSGLASNIAGLIAAAPAPPPLPPR